MTTLLDVKPSATSNVQSPDEATLDQVLLRIAALAPMVARLAPDIEQGRRLPAELVAAKGAGSSRCGPTRAAVAPRHSVTAGTAVLARLS